MGLLILREDDDGTVTHVSVNATGHAQAGGQGVALDVRFRNTAEYTTRDNPSQTAEYRHLPTSNRDRTHRR